MFKEAEMVVLITLQKARYLKSCLPTLDESVGSELLI